MKTEIIYEDKDILVIYKPAGLATQTAKLGQSDVISELKGYLAKQEKALLVSGKAGAGQNRFPGKSDGSAGQPYLGIIHRLDQPVEGLLVFAKNKKVAGDLTAQLQRQVGEVGLNKHYYAVLCGKPSPSEGELVDYMYKSPENVAVIVEQSKLSERAGGKAGDTTKGTAEPKEARLCYKILASAYACDRNETNAQEKNVLSSQSSSHSQAELHLADIEIFTGRFHQIRAQMAHAGMPLLGDAKYGDENAKELARMKKVRNVALCAYSLEFLHPVTKKKMNFEIKPKGIAFSLVKGT